MYSKLVLSSARLAYIRLADIFDAGPTDYHTDDSFANFYKVLLSKLEVSMEAKDLM